MSMNTASAIDPNTPARIPVYNKDEIWQMRHNFIQAQAAAAWVWESMPAKERNRLKSIAGRKGTEKARRSASEIAFAIQQTAAEREADHFLEITGSKSAAARRLLSLCEIEIPIEFFVK